VRAAALGALSSLVLVGCQKVPLLAPSGSTITLTAVATALPFNSTTEIVAQIIEPAGTPPQSGTHVIFTTSLGRIEPSEAQTDINGRATVRFVTGTASGTATIIAASGGANVGATGALKIAVGAAAVGQVVVGANPTTISAAGGSSVITASVFDSSGNALNGVSVTFATDVGSVSPVVVTTDASGSAQTRLTTNRTAKVTATAGVGTSTGGTGGTGGTTTPAPFGTVTVTVNTTSAVTVGTPTPATPSVGQTVSIPLTYPTGAAGASPVTQVIVDWGDGVVQTFSGQPGAVSHAFSRAGSYLVQVTGLDAFGDRSPGSASVTVGARPQPTVTISSTTASPTAGSPVTFAIVATPTTGNSISSIVISWGDGDSTSLSGNATSVQHVFTSAGTYTVSATATDTSGASGAGSTVIVVSGAATASFVFTPTNPAAGTAVSFNASGSTSANTITSYTWNFGDPTSISNTGTGVTASHTFANAGTYTVTLTITDSAGRTATTSRQVPVS
jgi:PKD repeat protein